MTVETLNLKVIKTHEFDQVHHEIASGDLLAWSEDDRNMLTSLLNKLVRVFTLSEFSHVGIAYRENDRLYVLEATIPKIRLRLLSECRGFYHIPTYIEWLPEFDALLKRYINKPYGFLDALRGYIGYTNKSDDRWQCAELCVDFYKQIGITLNNAYTPAKLVKAAICQFNTSIDYVDIKSK